MEQKKIRLKGHETFILREGWLTKAISAVEPEDHKVFADNYGADELGVGSNMAKAIRYWIRESGIMKELPKANERLTEIGTVIAKEDLYMENISTLWILHVNLALNAAKVTSWYTFFNLLESSEFTKEELIEEMNHKILEYSGLDSIPERSLSDDVNAVLSMYCREHLGDYDPEDKKISPFVRLGLLKKYMNRYVKEQPSLEQLDNKVILYILNQYRNNHEVESISIDDIVEKPELPGKLCNLGRVAVNQYLDELVAEGFITVNRTAGLDMMYFPEDTNWKKEYIVQMLY